MSCTPSKGCHLHHPRGAAMESPSCLVMSFHSSLLSSPMAADNGNCTLAHRPMMNTRDKQRHARTSFTLCLGEKQAPFPYRVMGSTERSKWIIFVINVKWADDSICARPCEKRMGKTQCWAKTRMLKSSRVLTQHTSWHMLYIKNQNASHILDSEAHNLTRQYCTSDFDIQTECAGFAQIL